MKLSAINQITAVQVARKAVIGCDAHENVHDVE